MAAELRKDMVRDNWVIIATDRALKPNDFPINKTWEKERKSGQQFCPFCEGNEIYTTEEIAAFRDNNTLPDTPGWTIRTIPNKFSAFKLDGALELKQSGIFESCNGLGQHEVVVETPQHGVEFYELPVEKIKQIYIMLQQRYNHLAGDPRVKYIQIYKNQGLFAGASLEHSHSQILALPSVPRENQGLIKYYNHEGKCLLCKIKEEELASRERLVYESEHFLLICPYASRFSYETWLIPRRHTEHFAGISNEELNDLSLIMKAFMPVMIECLSNPSYNIVINTAPVNQDIGGGYHWFMEIIPRLIVPAGVEFATGFYMNPVSPEVAAAMLREKVRGY
ncbi:MAG: galactose-1-phosphate uridylyltransferase [Syntrophomonadaceae bacterium]|jgi:UDPglucose--hexose-1-phosphate uridylyltransferase